LLLSETQKKKKKKNTKRKRTEDREHQDTFLDSSPLVTNEDSPLVRDSPLVTNEDSPLVTNEEDVWDALSNIRTLATNPATHDRVVEQQMEEETDTHDRVVEQQMEEETDTHDRVVEQQMEEETDGEGQQMGVETDEEERAPPEPYKLPQRNRRAPKRFSPSGKRRRVRGGGRGHSRTRGSGHG
jgi:hypothetical protein